MRKKDNILKITIELPGDFKSQMLRVMDDEFDTACKKWRLNIPTENRNLVFEHSIKQVESKVAAICRVKWSSDSKLLHVNVLTKEKCDIELLLPRDEEVNFVKLIKVANQWNLDGENNEDATPLGEFRKKIQEDILEWCRVAIFYGVGSYA